MGGEGQVPELATRWRNLGGPCGCLTTAPEAPGETRGKAGVFGSGMQHYLRNRSSSAELHNAGSDRDVTTRRVLSAIEYLSIARLPRLMMGLRFSTRLPKIITFGVMQTH